MGPTDCFVAASIFAALAGWFLFCAVSPRLRKSVMSGQRGKLSVQIYVAWALFLGVWSSALRSEGFRYHPLTSRMGWLLGGAFLGLLGSTLWEIAHQAQQANAT
jgi:hypothetical protein